AQVVFTTSVIKFAGYVIQRPAGDATQSAAHYDITFPNIPLSLALCPASPAGIGMAWSIDATTASQSSIPAGVGRPNTVQVRSTKPLVSGSQLTTATMKSDDASHPFTIPANCTVFATVTVDFHCGNG